MANRRQERLLYNLVVLGVVTFNYILLTLQQQQQQQQEQRQRRQQKQHQQHQQHQHQQHQQQHQQHQQQRDQEIYRQHGARSLAVGVVILSYQFGIEVTIRTDLGLGMITSLAALHLVCLIISKLRSARVVDAESASQLVSLVERLNVWTIFMAPRPMGMSPLQAVVHAVAFSLRALRFPTGDTDDTASQGARVMTV